ncbi:hypothetical protein FOZ60_017114 [Perkinsus olseni]|uniref:Uncharacterized protein n=1 Tax=Perkinsus olseni TaxID=32597 RepID=A0A7J6P373_PEROL|nr:hypothetical protein FOZ60_017114 [Perkinsus olseni]
MRTPINTLFLMELVIKAVEGVDGMKDRPVFLRDGGLRRHHHHKKDAVRHSTDDIHFLRPKHPRRIRRTHDDSKTTHEDLARDDKTTDTEEAVRSTATNTAASLLRGRGRESKTTVVGHRSGPLPVGFGAPPTHHFHPTSFKLTIFYILYTLSTAAVLVFIVWLAYAKLPPIVEDAADSTAIESNKIRDFICCLPDDLLVPSTKPVARISGPQVITITRSYSASRAPSLNHKESGRASFAPTTSPQESSLSSCCSSLTPSASCLSTGEKMGGVSDDDTIIRSTSSEQLPPSAFMSPIGTVT